jgi:UDP-N-acetyl-D-glucosamine dehydrogenase
VPFIRVNEKNFKSVDLAPGVLRSMDMVVILTDHSAFDYSMVAKFSPLIFDTRNALKDVGRSDVTLL